MFDLRKEAIRVRRCPRLVPKRFDRSCNGTGGWALCRRQPVQGIGVARSAIPLLQGVCNPRTGPSV